MRSPCQQRSKGRTAVHNPTDDGKKSVRITVDHRSPFCQGKSLSVLQLAPPIHARSQALHTHCLNDQRHTCQSFQVSKEHRLRNQHDSVCCNPSIKVLIVAQCWCKEALRALPKESHYLPGHPGLAAKGGWQGVRPCLPTHVAVCFLGAP